MQFLYNFDLDKPDEALVIVAYYLQKRRFEKRLSREYLTTLSGFPTPTIAKSEQKHTISLASYIALGYSSVIKELLFESIYNTMEELQSINKNKNRKRSLIRQPVGVL